MQTEKSRGSLSPLGKDQLLIGKLFRSKRIEELNPEATPNNQVQKKQSNLGQKLGVSVGINTSRAMLPAAMMSKYNIPENEVSPVTHLKIKQEFREADSKPQIVLGSKLGKVNSNNLRQNTKNSGRRQQENESYPGVVDFPSCYLYDQSSDPPETPDLPNRRKPYQPQQPPVKKIIEQQSETGLIKHQNKSRVFSNSAPKNLGKSAESQAFQVSSPQLPYINKIENNIHGFKKFINQPALNSSYTQINGSNFKNFNEPSRDQPNASFSHSNQPIRRKLFGKNIGQIIKRFGQRPDPEQQQKLDQKKSFRISVNNFQPNRRKLPTFRQENREQYQQQVDLDKSSHQPNLRKPTNIYQIKESRSKSKLEKLNSSNQFSSTLLEEDYQYSPGTLISNSFIKNTATNIRPDDILIIDLRTSIRKIKQALIEGEQHLAATFNIPEIFYRPPSVTSTSQELHSLMMEVFSFVGINPQIVSIKKYINCVVMREKKLCILWNFNGKIYFGGWKRDQTLAEGNKDGIGIQWVPSRYIYYGEFKDNKKEGYGVMKKSNKEIYIGCWKNNQRWGWGKVYDPEGQLHQNGEFIEGCFIYPQKGYREMSGQGSPAKNMLS